MEDENGLNLSLGLPCGSGKASQKGKTGSSSNVRTEEGDRKSNLINDFKNFLDGGPKKLGFPRSDLAKNEGNFFNDLSSAGDRHIISLRGETSHKRKRGDRDDKTVTSHISINTDDDSSGDNEDVVDSEAEGSTSRQVSQPTDSSKRRVGSSDQVQVTKEVVCVSDSVNAELPGQRRFANMSFGSPFSQSPNIINMPYSLPLKESNPSGTFGLPSYPGSGMVKVMATMGSERPGTPPLIPANMPLMFGYSHVQLSSMDRASHLHRQQLNARSSLNSDKHSDSMKITQASLLKSSGNGKHHTVEDVSSTRAEENVRGSNVSLWAKAQSEPPKADGLPCELPAIKPGLAADVKFGGCGSYPNLPWVSTTGSGPNGKTISGVTYRFSSTQIKIVCACHGSHMSPEEFVQHATEEPDVGGGVSSFPNSNSAASAQS